MLEDADLEAAVAEGIVTPAQAASLRDFALQRRKDRIAALGHEDERFRFMSGFNDVFLAIGVVLLALGLGFMAHGHVAGPLAAAAIMWLIAELLVRRMRLVLPGILLTFFFVAFVFIAVPAAYQPGSGSQNLGWLMSMLVGGPGSIMTATSVLTKFLAMAGAAAVFYARFRVPFALLPVALGLLFATSATIALLVPGYSPAGTAPLHLVCGLAIFAAAMAFDLSDRERVTRRADNAFWLHLLASPLIVQSLVALITKTQPFTTTFAPLVAAALAGMVVVLTVVAIVIDRRALLVSGLTYLGFAIAYGIMSVANLYGAGGGGGLTMIGTLIILGLIVLVLGVGWLPLRRRLMSLLPRPFTDTLPPVPVRI